MKNKYSILFISLALTTGVWAQSTSKLNGIPSGATVTVDGSVVTVTNGSANIEAGKTVKITPAAGKEFKTIQVVQKATTDQSFNLVGAQAISLAYKASNKGGNAESRRYPSINANSRTKLFAPANKLTDNNHDDGAMHRHPLYTLDAQGNLVEIDWGFNFTNYINSLEDANQQETARIIAKYTKFMLKHTFKISDNWIWAWDVASDVDSDEISEEDMNTIAGFADATDEEGIFAYVSPILQGLHEAIGEEKIEGKDDWKSRNFLIRVSDGAIFQWDNAPANQGDMTGSKIKMNGNYCDDNSINGFIEPFGDGIVYLNLQDKVVKVEVEGNNLKETQLSPNDKKALFVAPTADGTKIVTVLIDEEYDDSNGAFNGAGKAVLLDAQGNQEEIGAWYRKDFDQDRNGMEIFVINGHPYYFTIDYGTVYEDRMVTFYKVNTEGDAIGVGDELFAIKYSQYNLGRVINSDYVFDNSEGNKMSWINHQYAFTFDANATTLGVREIPEHYSSGDWDYINDVAYTIDGEESTSREFPGKVLTTLPTKYYICDLKANQAIEKTIDWSGITDEEKNFTDESLTWRYWPGTKNFIAHATLQNGTSVSYSISTAEESEGVVSILGKGTGLVVVTTSAIK
ncbi:MAG: hypothetical protein E7104_02010 [Prevotella sp.]|jgi:hypothetical protein|nr:hypothetical protein [Prevotella sp.]